MTQKTTTLLALTTSCFIASTPANAYWTLDADVQGTRMFLVSKEITQINAPSYFKISSSEIVTPSTITTEKVAILSGFSIDKIINVTPGQTIDAPADATIVSIPDELGVKYVDADGTVRVEAINQGDIVTVTSAPAPAPIIAPAVQDPNSSVITMVSVQPDNSVSAVIAPPIVDDPNKIVQVKVITDGRSVTAVGVDSNNPVIVNSLPQNSNVTVETTVIDTQTQSQTVTQNTIVTTPVAPIATPEPARNATVDKATIAAPTVNSDMTTDATGHRSVSINIPAIPNFDPSKTNVQLMVVGESGATTAMGADGTGATYTVGSLSPNESYTVKIVIRDLATGQETVITGNSIP